MKDIMLRIIGRQIDRNDEVADEAIEFMTEGKAYRKGEATYIVYEESEMSGMKGVKTAIAEDGPIGILTGGFTAAAGGIGAAVFFSVLAAAIFKPGDKN